MIATTADGSRAVIKRRLSAGEKFCDEDTATVEFVTNGPSDKTVCTLDGQPFFSCELHRHILLYKSGMDVCGSSGLAGYSY